jgi:hypothetical protein
VRFLWFLVTVPFKLVKELVRPNGAPAPSKPSMEKIIFILWAIIFIIRIFARMASY